MDSLNISLTRGYRGLLVQRIDGSGSVHVVSGSSAETEIENTKFIGLSTGLWPNRTLNTAIKNCVFAHNEAGISTDGGKEIVNNLFYYNSTGIVVNSTGEDGLALYNNTFDANLCGMYVISTFTDLTVKDNLFTNNTTGISDDRMGGIIHEDFNGYCWNITDIDSLTYELEPGENSITLMLYPTDCQWDMDYDMGARWYLYQDSWNGMDAGSRDA